ncbi:MAG: acyl carrier protein [Acholeplasmataceae bacterium]|nr:MAG: acyl carrier protein [Acholeplasmataceae bacterium]
MIFKKVVEVISDELIIRQNEISATTRLREDLNVDSLDVVELITDLEHIFKVTISDEEAAALRTVGDIVNLLESYQR